MSTETVTLEFEGYSDDTFGEYGQTNDDHDNCASGEPIVFRVEAGGRAVLVIGEYSHEHEGSTGWRIGIQAVVVDDDDSVPPVGWNIRFIASGCPYSPRLAMDVPSDFSLTCLQQDDDEDDS